MLKQVAQVAKQLASQPLRSFSTSKPNNFKFVLCGANGGIGQPLSMLLKMNPLVTQLQLYDVLGTPGVAADVSHIDTVNCVKAALGPGQFHDVLESADVVMVTAGLPRKPGMTRDDLFVFNAEIIRDIATAVSESCPKALLALITNPVNTVVPIAAEVLKKNGTYDPKRLFGVTTLDVVRSRAFIGAELNIDPRQVEIQVIGGHSGITIIPVLSQCNPKYNTNADALTKRIQNAGTEVVKAKAGAGSATLSMAYAANLFATSLLKGLNGETNIVDFAYVESQVTEAAFFSSKLCLGENGIQEILGLPELNDFETALLKKTIPELQKDIKKGVDFVTKCDC